MREVMHGDRAAVRVSGRDARGRPQGAIIEVLERGKRRIVGRLQSEHGVLFLVPEDRRIAHDILVPPGEAGKAKAGQVATVELVAQPSRHAQPIGRVAEVLGHHADPGMEIEIAVRKFDLPHEFSKKALAQARALPETLRPEDTQRRRDLRKLGFVTIDGETAKDFDDAVYCERQGKGFRLWVAIADVSNYVKPKDALDAEAYERGNSVYFPRRVIPMLPEELSNELCSLKPDVDRLVMVCEMEVSASGAVKGYEFYNGVIHSHERMTYTKVWDMLSGKLASRPEIDTLYAVFKALFGERQKRGAIDFDSVETRMIFDDNGKILRIDRVHRNDAHRVIEECMLAANVCASDYLATNDQPTLYRVHEGPTPEKLEALRAMLKDFGLSLGGGDKPHAKDYAELLRRIKDKPYAGMLQTVM